MTSPNPIQLAMLIALNRLNRLGLLNVYAGTVPAAAIAKRRAANKRARISRRINRR